jgi:hypothetical protein
MANQNDGILAPLYQQVVDWFREKHWIDISIMPEVKQHPRNRSYTCSIYRDPGLGNGIERNILKQDGKILYWINPYNAYNTAIEEALKLI